MATRLLPPTSEGIAEAGRLLREGGLVAFPTETVYGLGANALDPAAVARIFDAKGRPATNPIIVHVTTSAEAVSLVIAWPASAAKLAERFWPGPLTLVLPRSNRIPDIITAGGPTVALRLPAHPVALALIRAAGVPLAAPSANRSTQLSPTTAQHVLASLGGRIDAVIDGGATPGGIESTVIDLAGPVPRLLRPGLLPVAHLEAILGPLTRPGALTPTDTALPSPGMLPRHYAPRTPLFCWETEPVGGVPEGCVLVNFGAGGLLPGDPETAAVALYALLHDLDARGLAGIHVVLPPDTPAWLAIRDRLLRAAHRE
jgi:L-threonylcarbamoyladenylate synthase